MFDKTFFKFALGFTAIIALSICSLYLANHINNGGKADQAATVR